MWYACFFWMFEFQFDKFEFQFSRWTLFHKQTIMLTIMFHLHYVFLYICFLHFYQFKEIKIRILPWIFFNSNAFQLKIQNRKKCTAKTNFIWKVNGLMRVFWFEGKLIVLKESLIWWAGIRKECFAGNGNMKKGVNSIW